LVTWAGMAVGLEGGESIASELRGRMLGATGINIVRRGAKNMTDWARRPNYMNRSHSWLRAAGLAVMMTVDG
jgi:hypothetical protein